MTFKKFHSIRLYTNDIEMANETERERNRAFVCFHIEMAGDRKYYCVFLFLLPLFFSIVCLLLSS